MQYRCHATRGHCTIDATQLSTTALCSIFAMPNALGNAAPLQRNQPRVGHCSTASMTHTARLLHRNLSTMVFGRLLPAMQYPGNCSTAAMQHAQYCSNAVMQHAGCHSTVAMQQTGIRHQGPAPPPWAVHLHNMPCPTAYFTNDFPPLMQRHQARHQDRQHNP
jgi:hypothetical protein